MSSQVLLWIVFNAFVVTLLVLDLKVLHRKAQVIEIKESLIWSGIWITLALSFNAGIYYWYGAETALEFLAGYLIEKSLSVDNIFVFLMIFSYFGVPSQYQHKVLFWGILGALSMRALFIVTGVMLIQKFHWIIYIFGALLIGTGIQMAVQKTKKIHPERNPMLRLIRRFLPVSDHYQDDKFFFRKNKRYFATPLFIVLMAVESTDVIFAVDSITAIFAITMDPFIVYTSNAFALLGMRALYFALAGIVRLFHYLHYGLAVTLIFVGAKLMLADIYKMPVGLALGVIAGVLLISVLASIARPREKSI